MKRLLLLILVLTLAVSNALAAEIDLSAMTEEELIELRVQIDELLGDSGDMIYEGTYVVGTDIKAGRYQLTCSKTGAMHYVIARIFESTNMGQEIERHDVYLGNSIYLNLEDGMTFVLKQGACTIQPVSSNWAP